MARFAATCNGRWSQRCWIEIAPVRRTSFKTFVKTGLVRDANDHTLGLPGGPTLDAPWSTSTILLRKGTTMNTEPPVSDETITRMWMSTTMG